MKVNLSLQEQNQYFKDFILLGNYTIKTKQVASFISYVMDTQYDFTDDVIELLCEDMHCLTSLKMEIADGYHHVYQEFEGWLPAEYRRRKILRLLPFL